MNQTLNTVFQDARHLLQFNPHKGSLRCSDYRSGEIIWIRRLDDAEYIAGVLADNLSFYVPVESGDKQGIFLCLERETGETRWHIPGRSLMQLVYDGFLYLIFIDDQQRYFLLKVALDNGATAWYHQVEEDLTGYSFKGDIITLEYASGNVETLDASSGATRAVS